MTPFKTNSNDFINDLFTRQASKLTYKYAMHAGNISQYTTQKPVQLNHIRQMP